MSNGKNPLQEGYRPHDHGRGYQPQVDTPNDPKPQGGYTPTGSGDSPANQPQPPDEE